MSSRSSSRLSIFTGQLFQLYGKFVTKFTGKSNKVTILLYFKFVYLRELDLEKVNRGTVEKLSKHKALKKLIVHGCRNYDVFQDFKGLPQLLVVKGEIMGLKQMLGDIEDIDQNQSSLGSAGTSEKSSSSYNGSRLGSDDSRRRIHHSPSPIAVSEI
jgi:hypothetical protein